ncbi:hypothetical protein AB0F46_08450 [Streptomyces sp. NPDC026665]|uniref:hypothetical protein n=1 Tax=Streptomyces sp. NPDC026665 TaxID=3154798 RepID=UPI0033E8C85D
MDLDVFVKKTRALSSEPINPSEQAQHTPILSSTKTNVSFAVPKLLTLDRVSSTLWAIRSASPHDNEEETRT